MKPGVKTTEFWLSLAALGAGVTLAIVGAVTSNDVLVQTGTVMATGAVAGYSVSRGFAKLKGSADG